MSTARRWEKSYPDQLHGYRVRAESLQGNVANFARQGAEKFASNPAFTLVLPTGLNTDLSFLEIDRLSSAFAAYLVVERGLQPGDVLPFKKPESARAMIEDMPIFEVEVGALGSQVAVKIVEPISPNLPD